MDDDLMQVLAVCLTPFAGSQAMAIQWPNKEIDKRTVQEWARVAVLPVPPTSFTVKGGNIWQWECQVSIYCKPGTGTKRATYLSAILKEIFPKGAKLCGAGHVFDVTQSANPVPPIPLDGWFSTPVTFRVQTIH